ncbi:MAG: hypothetical protein ACTSWQ_02930, partial [Candidatus Thorarchaeota archaeon]
MTEETVRAEVLENKTSPIDNLVETVLSKEFRNNIIHTVISILMALAVAAIIMVATGYNPGEAFSALGLGALL